MSIGLFMFVYFAATNGHTLMGTLGTVYVYSLRVCLCLSVSQLQDLRMTVPANADVIPSAYAARYCVCDNHYELILLRLVPVRYVRKACSMKARAVSKLCLPRE